MDWSLLPLIPLWAIFLVAVGLIALLAHGSIVLLNKKVPPRWVGILGGLRIAAIVLFVLCLLRPIMSYSKQLQRSPSLIVLVDTSQSMNQAVDAAGTSRLESAAAQLGQSDLGSRIAEQFDARWYAFDRDARPIVQDDVAALEPTGDMTNLADSLRTAWAYQSQLDAASLKQSTAAGRVVLVTDGNDPAAREAVTAARELGLKVYTLAPSASEDAPIDSAVVITGLQSPSRVLIGSEGRFQATIRHTGAFDVPMVAQLSEDGRPVVAQEFAFAPNESERRLTLIHRPTNVGNRRYTLSIAPQQGSDSVKTGSSYDVNVKVIGKAAEVLVLEDRWRWEFKYLRRVLEADPNFTFTAFMSRGPATYLQFAEPDSNVRLAGFPRSGAELEWFDVIVLGDVNPSRWPQSLAPSIYRLVSEQGKSLVVVAGPGIERFAADPALRSLLPVEVVPATARPVPGPVSLRLTPEGAGSPFFYSAPGEGSSPWADMPTVDQIYMPLRKRPAATVLIDAPSHSTDFGSAIVVAEHTVGKGRVLYVGTDTLWRWQMLGASDELGVTPHQLFWQQALRALAPRSGARGNVTVSLDPDRTRYMSGETIAMKANVTSASKLSRPELEAVAHLPGGDELPVVLVPDPAEEGAYRAKLDASEAGAYRIVVQVSQDGTALAESTSIVDVEASGAESTPAPVNTTMLTQIAASTGGSVIDLEDPATWPTRGTDEVVDMAQAKTLDLWNSWILILMLIALLGADWLIRLLRGFV